MKKLQNDVRSFSIGVGNKHSGYPGKYLNAKDRRLCYRLINEEYREFIDSVIDDDIVEEIDATCDLMYVLIFNMIKKGVDLTPFWDEVQKNNMTKLSGPKDKKTGKQLKPKGWKPPNIAGILAKMRKH